MLPSNAGRKGRPFHDNRKIVEGIVYRARTGIPWRDLPRDQFGPWQTVWKRHYLYARLGVWDRIHAAVMAQADAEGDIEWTVSVDSTINRAHQHGTNTTRPDQPTGGHSEPQQSDSRGAQRTRDRTLARQSRRACGAGQWSVDFQPLKPVDFADGLCRGAAMPEATLKEQGMRL